MAAQDDRRRLFDLLADRALGEALSADEARDLGTSWPDTRMSTPTPSTWRRRPSTWP